MKDEYPSNVYPWFPLKEKGVKIHFFDIPKNNANFLKEIENKITNKTKCISFSGVYWLNGYSIPLEKIANLCEQKNILFIVDGSQTIGNIPISLKKCRISGLAFSAWKWLLGPTGLGVLFLNEKFNKIIETSFSGKQLCRKRRRLLQLQKKL